MEAYPRHYVEHNTPLMVVSGLIPSKDDLAPGAGPTVGMRISSPLPSLDSPPASILLRCFVASNNSGYWPGKAARIARAAGARGPGPAFRIRIVGREYVFPPRKASPPAVTVPASPPAENLPARNLHSPLSPLSPQSPLYPDGVMTPLWFGKHQDLVPAVFISCFELYTETIDSNTQNQKDNELIKAINDLKRKFGTSTSTNAIGSGSPAESNARRTKFAVILVAEKSMLHSPDIDERLSMIRRSTALENNSTLFFLPAPSSPVEIQAFVKNIQFRLFPLALEYYRDLSKHCRRKRKNPAPLATVAPTTASTTMSDVGWGVRYEIKLGVFAEFRQEMDAASRNYESAYEGLISDIFYTTNLWSERWSEARLLADILTIRVIRCLLWLESYTAAVRRWEYHIEKMKSLVDGKGKGTQTYGFAAWLSTWNRMLAELAQAQNLPIFATTSPQPSNSLIPSVIPNPNVQIYAPPEKSIQFADKVRPQDHLHHSGFYYLAAANYAADRHARALKYTDPEPYDDYLCLPPADEVKKVDHHRIQTELFELARKEFLARDQKRMGAMMSHNIARLKMEKADWSGAWSILQELSVGYREEGWLSILEEVLWRMVECARRSEDGSKQVIAELELLSSKFGRRAGWRYDLMRCLEGLPKPEVKPIVALQVKDVVSFLSASFTFKAASACVGEHAVSQFVLESNAQEGSAPVVWSSIKITFEGGMKTILLTHDASAESQAPDGHKVRLVDLKGALHEPDSGFSAPLSPTGPKSYVVATTDLTLYPGETKIFELSVILRETGLAKCMAATFFLDTDEYDLEYFVVLEYDGEGWTDELGIGKSVGSGSRRRGCGEITPAGGNAAWWVTDKNGRQRKTPVRNEDPTALTVLPKPPKIEVIFNKLDIPAFIDEDFLVRFDVRNEEDEEVEVSLDAKIMGYPEEEPIIQWILPDGKLADSTPSLFPLGRIPAMGHLPGQFSFPTTSHPAEVIIEVTVHYHLLSDPETPIIKTTDVDLPIVSPFAVTHDWSPRVHPDKYPSIADFKKDATIIEPGGKPEPKGITQRWCLTAILTNLEAKIDETKRGDVQGVDGTTLIVEGWSLDVAGVAPGAECRVVEGPTDGLHIVMDTLKPTEAHFILDIQRLSFEDRRHFHLDTAINIKWRRDRTTSQNKINSSKFSFPRLPIPGVEPRVLVVADTSKTHPHLPQLTYTVENPTRYPLTFHYGMDENQAFTFTGTKQDLLPMPPLSRVEIVYQLRPSVKHAWVKPVFKVEDRQFRKVLRCMPAGARGTIAIDKEKRVIVWIDNWEETAAQPKEEIIDPEDPLGALSLKG